MYIYFFFYYYLLGVKVAAVFVYIVVPNNSQAVPRYIHPRLIHVIGRRVPIAGTYVVKWRMLLGR